MRQKHGDGRISPFTRYVLYRQSKTPPVEVDAGTRSPRKLDKEKNKAHIALLEWLYYAYEHDRARAVEICEHMTPYCSRRSTYAMYCQLTDQWPAKKRRAFPGYFAIGRSHVELTFGQQYCFRPHTDVPTHPTDPVILGFKDIDVLVCIHPTGVIDISVLSIDKGEITKITTLLNFHVDELVEQHRRLADIELIKRKHE